MFGKRLKIFVAVISLALLACVARLIQMQVVSRSYYQERIEELKKGRAQQLKTIRGRISDRKDAVLADDEPRFRLSINYRFCSLRDYRVEPTISDEEELKQRRDDLETIIEKCAQFKGGDRAEIEAEIDRINNFVWDQRRFHAWRTNYGGSPGAKLSQALADFAEKQPDPDKRIAETNKVNLIEMHQDWPLLDLEDYEDVFVAQDEFLGIEGIEITPRAARIYPQGSAAAQTIGWVGMPLPSDIERLRNESLASYRPGDISGRDGLEYVCEEMLRGRRGRLVYNIDRKLTEQTNTQFGRDIKLTLDIVLQQQIELILTDPTINVDYHNFPAAAVLIDVENGDILALASTPVYNLNRARYDWNKLNTGPNSPLINRAINKNYPPGSVVKPLILIAGLEQGRITPEQTISCPTQQDTLQLPLCWIFKEFKVGHDSNWSNHARNAIKGSCNIYFSRLANRIDSDALRNWLLKFSYGRRLPLAPNSLDPNSDPNSRPRRLVKASGKVSSGPQADRIAPSTRRMFGIGQGDLRVTPLQVANTMATIARGGLHLSPRLVLPDANGPQTNRPWTDLNLSPQTIAVVHDGMHAVVNETGGTAAKVFADRQLAEQGLTVYGKTGSTETPENAWFAGFAKDNSGRCIAIALVVEQGQSGSRDAAPVAKEILQLCIDLNYIGYPTQTIQ